MLNVATIYHLELFPPPAMQLPNSRKSFLPQQQNNNLDKNMNIYTNNITRQNSLKSLLFLSTSFEV